MSGLPCCPITPFQVALSMPTCALKSPKRTRDSDEVAFSSATSTSSRKTSYCDSILGHKVRTPARYTEIAPAYLAGVRNIALFNFITNIYIYYLLQNDEKYKLYGKQSAAVFCIRKFWLRHQFAACTCMTSLCAVNKKVFDCIEGRLFSEFAN